MAIRSDYDHLMGRMILLLCVDKAVCLFCSEQ